MNRLANFITSAIGIIVLSLLFFFAFKSIIIPLDKPLTQIFALCMTTIPILFWGPVFLRLYRKTPLPVQIITISFLLGLFISRVMMLPTMDFFIENVWGINIGGAPALISFSMFYGFLSVFFIMLSFRLAIDKSEYFNEPFDAVVFSFMVGMGFAMGINIDFVFSQDSLNLGVILSRLMLTSISFSAASGILGMGAARAKFQGISNKRFGIYLIIASLFMTVLLIFTNLAYLNIPGVKDIYTLFNLIFYAIVSSVVMGFVVKGGDIKYNENTRKKTISTKPALLITLFVTVVTILFGNYTKAPDCTKYTLSCGDEIRIPSGAVPNQIEENHLEYTIPFRNEIFNVDIVEFPDKKLDNIVMQYTFGIFPVTPIKDYRRIQSGMESENKPVLFMYYRLLEKQNGFAPAVRVGIDAISGTNTESASTYFIRVEGSNMDNVMDLLKYITGLY